MGSIMMLGQMLGGATRVWLEFAFLISLFAVLIFRPERIRSLNLFQTACGVVALSMILPSLLVFAMDTSQKATAFGSGMQASSQDIGLVVKLLTAAGPILFSLAFLCAVFSLMPSVPKRETSATPEEPAA